MAVWKEPADVATTEDLGAGPAFPAFSGVIDGVTLKVGNRVLVKDQFTSTENGYYQVVAGGPPTLMATDDTIEAEDVIRVSQGDGNARTAWALIDAANRIFARQDVKHYSLKSIDALKHFWQVLPEATATVAGYTEPGDKGGGDFMFLGVQDYARVTSAKPFDIEINNVTDVDGLVTVAATGHELGNAGNVTITRAYIKGLGGLVDDAYYVKVVDADTLTLLAYFTGVSFLAGAKIQYVKLITAAPHKRANGQRVSVAGVLASGGATPIAGINDDCGVIDETSLSIPIATKGGEYKLGNNALIGDDALMVPASDTDKDGNFVGNFGGLWQRLRADHVDVRWFGAKADWRPEDPLGLVDPHTDDLPAFNAAIAALGTAFPLPNTKAGKVVAEGFFYLSNTLHITKAVELVGAGNNSLSLGGGFWRPATVLAFPANTTGIRVHSGFRDDTPDGGSGNQAVIRDLMITCVELPGNWAGVPKPEGHGIHASARFSVENVNIENFWGNGINILATGDLVDGQVVGPEAGNAHGFHIINCNISGSAGHGVYVRGYANAGLVARTTAIVCQGWGFFDQSDGGNTYVACTGESNLGHGDDPKVERSYKTTNYGTNSSVFVGCYSEGGGAFPAKNDIVFPGMVLGGVLASSSSHIENSSAFVFQGGIAHRAPLIHINDIDDINEKDIWPLRVDIGALGKEMNAFEVSIPRKAQYVVLRLNKPELGEPVAGWLSFLHNGSRHLMQLPLMVNDLRRWAPQFRQGIFYYSQNAPTKLVSHTAGFADPIEETWERGDLIWNDTPAAGGPIGWVCITSGTQGTLVGVETSAPMNVGDTTVTLSKVDGLVPGEYIKIGNGTGTYKILKVTLPTIDIPAPGARGEVPSGVAIEIVGGILVGVETAAPMNVGDTTVTLNKAGGLVPGQHVTIGGRPDTYEIVKVTLPTIDIVEVTPGALVGVPVGTAIAFNPATFSTFGVVENIGNSTSYSVDKQLELTDRHITVIATGRIMTLPASPVDGQTHSIKSQAGVTTKVDTEGGVLTIDGQASVTLAPGDNGVLRYSAATGEWELR